MLRGVWERRKSRCICCSPKIWRKPCRSRRIWMRAIASASRLKSPSSRKPPSSGRLETAEESLHLQLAENLEEAMPLAQNLDARNRERQQIEKSIVEEVTGAARSKCDAHKDFVIIEGQLLWHIGVVG